MSKALIIPEEEIGDFTADIPSWKIAGEEYTFIETFLLRGDGERHAVIVQRESDQKYFQFTWVYSYGGNYHYNKYWSEVKPEAVTKTIWHKVE